MLSTTIAISFISALCFQPVISTSVATLSVSDFNQSMEHQKSAQRKAVGIWEQAIAAKGGRERLYAVRNIVISTKKDATGLFTENQVRREELLVFPNKYWFWNDHRPNIFGLRISMYDYDRNISCVVSDVEPNDLPEPIKSTRRNKALRNNQLSFLLETAWLKPTIVRASTGRIGLRPVDIVQTMVEGERVDFAFHQETHLPVNVSFHDVVNGKTYVNVQSFSDYAEIGGIKVPQTIEYANHSKYKATYQFNVEYNEDIFVKAPSISAGPEAWKVKKR